MNARQGANAKNKVSAGRQVNAENTVRAVRRVNAQQQVRTAQAVQKRSVSIAGHRTSVSLEPAFWSGLKEIAKAEGIPLAALIATIDRTRTGNLSSALRVFVLDWAQNRPSKT